VAVLVRTWNVFHGNAFPPERCAFVEEMVRLVTADRPDVVCLQEVPAWATRRLGGWSGMTARSALAARPRLLSVELGRIVTDLHHGLFRSAFTGQANSTLLAPHFQVVDEQTERVDRRGEGERRICHALRVEGLGIVANFHVTGAHADEQFHRVVEFVETVAGAGEPVILCGDANVRPGEGRTYEELRALGYSDPAPGIDQILVRGLPTSPPYVWPDEQRRVGGRLLSDHAPVELRVG
jgi:endonuclease/exonuclease/phosphatase family metal-dependent hydrolase